MILTDFFTYLGYWKWFDFAPVVAEMVMPGDRIKMSAELIYPVAIEEGMRFAIREGGRTIGAGVVSKIVK